jgi:L-ascorbate metabolism protein UlaG (beta-lactamase superfamily)
MAHRYNNPDPRHRPHDMRAVFRWGILDRVTGRRRVRPAGPPAPRVEPDLRLIRGSNGPTRLTWVGHASFLGTIGGAHFLIDPVFSERVAWVVRRRAPAGLPLGTLPELDALLITHGHFDHLDEPSVLALPRDLQVFVPLGLARWFRRRGFARVQELDWWESSEISRLRITFVPARHWHRRSVTDVNRALWGGFVVEGDGGSVYHAGDSAWFDGFAEIGRRFPGLDAAMLPIGSYSPAWFMQHYHLSPEQAGRAFLELGARTFVPMHWGTLKLTDEPLSEPADRVRRWWKQCETPQGRELRLPAIGQTVVLDG